MALSKLTKNDFLDIAEGLQIPFHLFDPTRLSDKENVKYDKLFEEKGHVLYAYDSLLRKYIYRCACGRVDTIQAASTIGKKKKCRLCGYPTTREVKKIMEDNGCEPLFLYIPSKDKSVKFKCFCGRQDDRKWETIKDHPKCSFSECGGHKKKITIDVVRETFEKEGYKLLETEYKGVMAPMEYTCNNGHKNKTTFNRFKNGCRCPECDRESRMNPDDVFKSVLNQYGYKFVKIFEDKYDSGLNVRYLVYKCDKGHECTVVAKDILRTKEWNGCKECHFDTQRNSYADVYDYFEENGCLLLSTEYKNREELLEYTCLCGSISKITYRDFTRGTRCPGCTSERRAKSNLEKYGVENASKNKDVIQKIRDTTMANHGVEHVMQNIEFVKKSQETNLVRYGKKYAFCQQEVYDKIKEITRSKLGVDYPLQNPIYLQYNMITRKKTCIEKYGVEFPMQNAEVFDRFVKSSFSRKPFTFPSGRVVDVQGYEPRALTLLLEQRRIKEIDIITDPMAMPVFYYNDPEKGKRRYYPDIWICSENLIIEVKSVYTYCLAEENVLLKCQCVQKDGYTMELLIFDDTKLVESRIFNPQ